jgi:hypothetical protein
MPGADAGALVFTGGAILGSAEVQKECRSIGAPILNAQHASQAQIEHRRRPKLQKHGRFLELQDPELTEYLEASALTTDAAESVVAWSEQTPTLGSNRSSARRVVASWSSAPDL